MKAGQKLIYEIKRYKMSDREEILREIQNVISIGEDAIRENKGLVSIGD